MGDGGSAFGSEDSHSFFSFSHDDDDVVDGNGSCEDVKDENVDLPHFCHISIAIFHKLSCLLLPGLLHFSLRRVFLGISLNGKNFLL